MIKWRKLKANIFI